MEYLVRWAGYSAEDDTWQTRADLRTAKEAIDAFERQRKVQLPPEQTPAAGVKIYVPRGVPPPSPHLWDGMLGDCHAFKACMCRTELQKASAEMKFTAML